MQTATLVGVQASLNLTNSLTQIGGYTVPGGTSALVSHLCLCNKNTVPVKVRVTLCNPSFVDAYLAFDSVIQPNDSWVYGGDLATIVLGAGWSIRALCNTASSVDASMSVTQAV